MLLSQNLSPYQTRSERLPLWPFCSTRTEPLCPPWEHENTHTLLRGHQVPYTQHHYDLSLHRELKSTSQRFKMHHKGKNIKGESIKDLSKQSQIFQSDLKDCGDLERFTSPGKSFRSQAALITRVTSQKHYTNPQRSTHGVTNIGIEQTVNRGECQNTVFLFLL